MKEIKLFKNPVRVFVCDDLGRRIILSENDVKIAHRLINSVYYRQDVEDVLEERGYSEDIFQNEDLLQELTNKYQRERELSDGSDCDSCKDWRQCIDVVFKEFETQLEPYRRQNG